MEIVVKTEEKKFKVELDDKGSYPFVKKEQSDAVLQIIAQMKNEDYAKMEQKMGLPFGRSEDHKMQKESLNITKKRRKEICHIYVCRVVRYYSYMYWAGLALREDGKIDDTHMNVEKSSRYDNELDTKAKLLSNIKDDAKLQEIK